MATKTIHTPFTRATRMERLPALLRERILVLDGAMGTMVQRYQLSEADFRGERFADHPKDLRGDTDLLCLTKPDVVREIHAAYLAAGADIIRPTRSPRPGSRRPTTGCRTSPAR